MPIKKLFTAAAVAVGTGLALTGCATTAQLDMQGRAILLPDGRTVVCVASIDSLNGGSGGVSCDWERAK